MSSFDQFLEDHLPEPPASVLEVGCGQGELTISLSVAGYEIVGIDPVAPVGDLFRPLLLEDLEESAGPVDAVVAAHSLHHIRDLEAALDKMVRLLDGRGVLVLDELAWDRMDEATLEWLHGQRTLAVADSAGAPESLDELRRDWESHHAGVHGFDTMRSALDGRFEQRAFEWTTFLHRKLGGAATETLEQALIEAGVIRALGFRYAGAPRL